MPQWRKPKGSYDRGTPDWFVFNREAGGDFANAVPAQYSSVSLYNNATDGSMLHVHGLIAWSDTATESQLVLPLVGLWGTIQTGDTSRILPGLGMLFGQISINHSATFLAPPQVGGALWSFPPANKGYWPYVYPIMILAPGWSLVVQNNAFNTDLNVVFHWLVMGKNEGYF